MSAMNDGGPAWPSPEKYGSKGWKRTTGITMRDYFAGQAPHEPQPWFKPILPERPEDDWRVGERHCTNHNYAIEWARAHGGYVTNENGDAQIAYDNDIDRQRYIQWPYAWADAMLSARAQPSTEGKGT